MGVREDKMRLQDIAQVIRSKNAGPLCLTIDVIFGDDDNYRLVIGSGVLNPSGVAALYGLQDSDVSVLDCPAARAIKLVLPRKVVAGDPGDRDVYGAQQHAPILEIEL